MAEQHPHEHKEPDHHGPAVDHANQNHTAQLVAVMSTQTGILHALREMLEAEQIPPSRYIADVPTDGSAAYVQAPYKSVTIVNNTAAPIFVAPDAQAAEGAASGSIPPANAVTVAVGVILTVPLAGRALYIAATAGTLTAATPIPVYLWRTVREPNRS